MVSSVRSGYTGIILPRGRHRRAVSTKCEHEISKNKQTQVQNFNMYSVDSNFLKRSTISCRIAAYNVYVISYGFYFNFILLVFQFVHHILAYRSNNVVASLFNA